MSDFQRDFVRRRLAGLPPEQPPSEPEKPGLRTGSKYAWWATKTAASAAFQETLVYVRRYWKAEIVIALAYAVLFVVVDGSWGIALLTIGALFIAAVLTFLFLFLWTPIRDHRKLIWECRGLEYGAEVERTAHEQFRRTIHLQIQAHQWSQATANWIRQLREVVRTGNSMDVVQEWERIHQYLVGARQRMEHLGQPLLASQLPIPKDATAHLANLGHDRRAAAKACLEVVQPAHSYFRGWASAGRFQPFPPNAPGDGLHIGSLYSP